MHRFILNEQQCINVRDLVDNLTIPGESLFEWCDKNCQGRFWIGMGFCKFELEEDATLFRLTWT